MSNDGRHFFLGDAPSARWLEAFPVGSVIPDPNTLAQVKPLDILWLDATRPVWPEQLAATMKRLPAAHIVVLSAMPEEPEGLHALDLGARGYSHLHAVPELLQEIALVVCHGGLWVGPELLGRMVAATRRKLEETALPVPAGGAPEAAGHLLSMLSSRELEVAHAVAAGFSNREVAGQLAISERTVKSHLGAVFEKLGVRDRLQLALCLSTATVRAG